MSVRLRPGVLIDDALANALAKLPLRSRARQVSIANAAPAETAIPAGSRGLDVNVRYVRPAIYVWLSPDISVLVYRGQYAGLINASSRRHRGERRAARRCTASAMIAKGLLLYGDKFLLLAQDTTSLIGKG